ncbi:coiled-coil domain-containing protein [Treponema phagedenis]|uniref:hypothetical protein n=1 Tax=Treponema phagedenis TaxID=162 RepID=UPI0001F638F4|nr:hypothetical protein [Treponema phagedenis]EFW36574.1 hypothetical protein HMPREF9554_02980 [Treponema phagedenis F0421]TYT77916.1 hypothetical protein FS559_01630 [Treponema phagedenis]
MNTDKKNTGSLAKDLHEREQELKTAYINFGEKLISDNTFLPERNNEKKTFGEEWNELRQEREKATNTILKIKAITQRQGELVTFEKQLEKISKEHMKDNQRSASDFVLQFYKAYNHLSLECLADLKNKVEDIEEKISELQASIKKQDDEKNDAKFFEKIGLQVKTFSTENKIKYLQEKIKKIIIRESSQILAHSQIQQMYENGEFSDELAESYRILFLNKFKQSENDERKQNLEKEKQSLLEQLKECDCGTNPQKRIAVLTVQFKELDENIDHLCKEAAFQYCEQYLTDEGKEKDSAHSFPAEYAKRLHTIAAMRKSIAHLKYSIEQNELIQKHSAEDKKIINFKKSIDDYERGIKEYQQMIESAEKNIEISEAEKQELSQKIDALSAKIEDLN